MYYLKKPTSVLSESKHLNKQLDILLDLDLVVVRNKHCIVMKNQKDVQSEKLIWAGDKINSSSGKISQITNCGTGPRFRRDFDKSHQQ